MNYEIMFTSNRINFIKINPSLVEDYLIMVNDPDIQKNISKKKKVYTKEQELEWIDSKLNNNDIIFSMIEKENNEYIGNIEIMDIKNNTGELGICITKNKQAKHFGTEAIERIIDYAFNELNLDCLELNVYNFNTKAIKCYLNVGFIEDGIGKTIEDIHMKMLRK